MGRQRHHRGTLTVDIEVPPAGPNQPNTRVPSGIVGRGFDDPRDGHYDLAYQYLWH
jgi:hypothetical protein